MQGSRERRWEMSSQWEIEKEESLKSLQNYIDSEALRKQGVYVWAFPIKYQDKTTYGWEYELPDGQTSWYNEECNSYEDAMATGIAAVKNTIKDKVTTNQSKEG